jgi:hypothetical protein
MSLVLPEPIVTRILEFITSRKTGQIALNFFEGAVLTADVKEHIKGGPQKILDKYGNQ